MSLPLIATKFNIPATGPKIVQRPRLLRLLDESLEQNARLVLVCAPAGYGKTTVVSEWLQDSQKLRPYQYAWLTLERGDDDLTRFLTYFITAVQRIRPGFGGGVLKLLQTHKPSPVPVLATLLINELSEIPGPFFLVLDDFHLLTSESIQGFTSFLLDHQPPQMRLVLITRSDPPIPLARLRARGQLVELRQNELCFLAEEAAEFTNQAMGLALSSDQVDFLAKQTEGWISGLQLAAISMHEAQDHSAFIKAFSGEHEFIADYLTEEVLTRLPENLRTFLLQTSILERLSASLCEAVTGQPGAQAVLEQLLAANLFIVLLDNQHTWYRYHILFADLLGKRLQSSQGGTVGELHERASRWFEENGFSDLAIEHAIAGKAFGRASQLIEQVSESLLMHGQVTTLLRWLEALPEAEILARPLLGFLYGFSLILGGQPVRKVASLLEKVRESGDLDDQQGEMNMLLALVAILQGDAAGAIQLSEQALQQLPPGRAFFRSLAADTLGMGFTLAGDIPAATRAFEQVVEISQQSENVMMTIMALTNLAGLQYFHGYFRVAISTCQQALELAHARIGGRLPMIGKTLLNLGEIVREQGDLDTALQYLSEAAGLMEDFSELGPSIAYLSLARLMMNKKDWPAAQMYIDRARQLARASQSTKMDDELVENVQALLWIRRGELIQAAHWARGLGLLDRSPVELLGEAGRNASRNEFFQSKIIILIRLYIAQKQPEKAGELIDWLTQENEKRGYKRRGVEFLVLKALTFLQMNETNRAVETLAKALPLGDAEGYFMTFVEEGEPMARLLYAAIQRKITPPYTSRLLDAIVADLSEPAGKEDPPGRLIEPLSERELEVLRSIAEGCSNAEIAGQLFISLSTVKGHTTHIFGKLGVKNRTQAVSRARSLGLLVPD